MKKRIGNDITFTWHIFRKDGDTQVPESFTGKEVEVKLISPLQRPVTIEDVSIATGVVTFTFRGKHQVTLGNYVAVLQENRGEDGMVTIDVVSAVTLVPHSYMEEDGDEGDVIEAEAVELTSTISAGGGGGFVQQQADWAQTDDTAVNFILHKPDLGLYVPKMDDDGHGNMSIYSPGNIALTLANEQGVVNQTGAFWAGGWSVSSPDGKFQTFGNSIYRGTMGFDHDSVVWEKTATQQIPTATTSAPGLMSAADKQEITDIEAVIPEQASSSNQLADKDFVNSSIATATATYRGSYNLVSDLLLSVSATQQQIAEALATKMAALSITPDNNDYCFVQIPTADATPTEIARIDRYKYDGTAWAYEYSLNNSSFTAAQWATLNSGITSGLVAKLSALPTNSELTTLLNGKANTSDLAEVATSGSYNDLSGKPTIPTVPSNVSAFNNDAGYITEDDVDDVPTANSNNPVKSGGVYGTTPSIANTDAESDLDISDEDGNVLMRLSGGHIKTKNFDSSNLPSGNIIDTSSKAICTVANTLTNGQTMTLNNPNLKNHYTLSFSATVSTMGTITIVFGSENAWSKGRVEITPTNIVYYEYGTWEPITIPHNIDIQENISVIIKTTKVHFAEIYLIANNSQFHQEISWNGSGNGCSLSNANGSYSNCTFSLNCQGLLKNVWIFGDSYTNSWPLRLDELGFDNYLLDGFSGRNSQQAYESFLKDIAIAKPKAIIWMMGMNDPDNGSVNSSWKTAFDNVKTLCDTYKIEFIYTTIPCVPQRDNSYKNNYAINSGVRIIPIASILGASSQGSSWYAGLLSSDNVHPSNSGSLWIALTLLNNITLLQEK